MVFLEFHGFPKEFNGSHMDFNGFLRISIVLLGILMHLAKALGQGRWPKPLARAFE